jgi:uncharacterized membrane protein YeaQ/YmgE (transglycosylase-associated protein family)
VLRWVLSDVFLVLGAIWFLQGIGVLPGSFMSHSLVWAVIGAVVVLLAAQMQRRWIVAGSEKK